MRRQRRVRAEQEQAQQQQQRGLLGGGEDGTTAASRAMEEGFNELGEIPPPYGDVEARKEGSNGRGMVVTVETLAAPAEPPPAYVAAMALGEARPESIGRAL